MLFRGRQEEEAEEEAEEEVVNAMPGISSGS
jgi:hypothetical protein